LLVDDADEHLEAARACNSGKIQAEAYRQYSIRIDRAERADFIQIDLHDGSTSFWGSHTGEESAKEADGLDQLKTARLAKWLPQRCKYNTFWDSVE
jgi:hypothetical protein